MLDKKQLSEEDITSKYILPSLEKAGWDLHTQIRQEVFLTAGRIEVKGGQGIRQPKSKCKRADVVLYHKSNIPIGVIEVKSNKFRVQHGIQQALAYADMLDVPSAFSSNGDAFYEHDRARSAGGALEREISLDAFPSPAELWQRYKQYKNIGDAAQEKIAAQDYYHDGSGREPRYYQQAAINRAVEAIAQGRQRILLTMATGTGKTYTAFQIIHRLWRSGAKKRILFLADRNALINQTARGDFSPFKDKMTVIRNRRIDKAYEIYLALYQGLTDYDETTDIYRQFSPDFFDLVVIDECHRGSARDDRAWRKILDYFGSATHIGLTATPKEDNITSSTAYFGKPLYTYSLKQGILDGFLAPYKVLRVGLNVDLEGWRPEKGKRDKQGEPVEDREYNPTDYDRSLVIDERTQAVAARISEFLRKTSRYDKTIVFCVDIEHAERMRAALVNENADMLAKSPKYAMKITGDDPEGKMELDNFINPECAYPVIATTSKLMTTGIDAQTCKLIVLDSNIKSMTEFKQIIGRGTRVNEEYDKTFFTIMDFRNVTELFADPDFDGDPVQVGTVAPGDPIPPDDGEDIPADEGEYGGGGDEGGSGIGVADPPPGDDGYTPRKQYVDGVDVSILNERVQHLDAQGKPITLSLRDYTREKVLQKFRTLDDFLSYWNESAKKSAIIGELSAQGLVYETMKEEIQKHMDIFDLICHVAYGQPPLTRAERARNVKKRNYFAKYGEQARQVLEALLDKYADSGVENIEDIGVLQIQPLTDFGSPMEIVQLFGGKANYERAVAELESEIYKGAA